MPPATRQGRDVQLARTVAAATTAAIDAQNQLQEKRKHHHTHPLIIFVLSVFALIMLLHSCSMVLHQRERKALVLELHDARTEIDMLRTYAARHKLQRQATRGLRRALLIA